MIEYMRTILITGGAGFIGSHVNDMLNKGGHATVVLDNLSTGVREAVMQGTFIEGDIADTPLLDKIFTTYKIDVVMHFAASIDVGESITNPAKYFKNNLANTINLLNAMIRHKVNIFIFSSTAAVYGNPLNTLIDENHPCIPINPYGTSKLMVEQILFDFAKHGLKYCALRYFNAAGGDPNGKIKNFKKIEHNLIPSILRTSKVTIYGSDYDTPDGTCIRDYIHVTDLGAAHIAAMERLFHGGSSACYNLGNGNGFSVREIIASVEEVTKQEIKIAEGPRRAGDPPVLVADSKRARKELGWTPQYPNIDKIIEDAWQGLKGIPQ